MEQVITTGTIVKIWKDNSGYDYVVAGIRNISRNVKELDLIKNTCINKDGSIHAATAAAKKIHKTAQVVKDFDGFYHAPKVKRILGQRRLNVAPLAHHLAVCGSTAQKLKTRHEVHAPLGTIDARVPTSY